MESSCNEEDGSINPVSDSKVGMEVLMDLGEGKGNS